MSIFRSVLIKLGLANFESDRAPISVFLLDDDRRRHRWFKKRFEGDDLSIAEYLNEKPDLQRASTIIVHTRNADAAIKMVEKLRETGRNVEYCAFPMLDLKIKNYWKR